MIKVLRVGLDLEDELADCVVPLLGLGRVELVFFLRIRTQNLELLLSLEGYLKTTVEQDVFFVYSFFTVTIQCRSDKQSGVWVRLQNQVQAR